MARVSDTIAEPRAAALLDGKPVAGFEVARSRGASEVEVGGAVQKALAELRAQHPDIELTEAFNFVEPVQEEYDGSLHLLYEGAILAVIVVWLFLRDWRATFVSAVALPMSAIPAFIGMYLLGFSINVVTLLALSLVVGILVDDAIVEVENIVRHLRMGKTPYQAAMEAADEIGLAVIATTFTLIAVFLPTAFMSGVAGKFFKQFGWTASLAVFASLVVARMLTPMMAAYILKPLVGGSTKEPRWLAFYMRWPSAACSHRFTTMVLATLFFFGSVAMIPLLQDRLHPARRQLADAGLPVAAPGATLAQTLAMAEETRARVMAVEHVKSVYTTVGGGSAGGDPFANFGTPETRKATLTIKLADRGDRPRKQGIENEIRNALETAARRAQQRGPGRLRREVHPGADRRRPAGAARPAALAVEKDLRTIPGLGNITSTASLIRPEIAVRPNFARAADLGVTSSAIAETLRVATLGDYDQALPKLNLAQRQVPIVVKLRRLGAPGPRAAGAARGARQARPGDAGPGRALTMEGGPAVIDRYDRSRNVNFEIELSGVGAGRCEDRGDEAALDQEPAARRAGGRGRRCRDDGRAVRELRPRDAHRRAVHLHRAGAAVQGLPAPGHHPVRAAAVARRRLRRPADRRRRRFSMPSLIGLIMLMGVATKNSILLVEYAIVARRDHGMSRFDALLDACHKRARPIIMTTHRDGRRHAADRHRLERGRSELPLADGDGGDRRPDHLHRAEPAGGAGGVHLHRRPRALDQAHGRAHPRPAARPGRRARRGAAARARIRGIELTPRKSCRLRACCCSRAWRPWRWHSHSTSACRRAGCCCRRSTASLRKARSSSRPSWCRPAASTTASHRRPTTTSPAWW